MILLLLLAAAHPAPAASAVPDYMTSICLPYVKDKGTMESARAKIVAAGFRQLPAEAGVSVERFTKMRYEMHLELGKTGRSCAAFDARANFAPMLAAAKRIVAQDPALKVTENKTALGYWRWDSSALTVEAMESGNDFVERIAPGMRVYTHENY